MTMINYIKGNSSKLRKKIKKKKFRNYMRKYAFIISPLHLTLFQVLYWFNGSRALLFRGAFYYLLKSFYLSLQYVAWLMRIHNACTRFYLDFQCDLRSQLSFKFLYFTQREKEILYYVYLRQRSKKFTRRRRKRRRKKKRTTSMVTCRSKKDTR